MRSKELNWDASGPSRVCMPLRKAQAPGNEVYSALQEVLEKLKGMCGQLLVGS